ncbi:unnamed protein product, partial [Prorocentrum cordatum]
MSEGSGVEVGTTGAATTPPVTEEDTSADAESTGAVTAAPPEYSTAELETTGAATTTATKDALDTTTTIQMQTTGAFTSSQRADAMTANLETTGAISAAATTEQSFASSGTTEAPAPTVTETKDAAAETESTEAFTTAAQGTTAEAETMETTADAGAAAMETTEAPPPDGQYQITGNFTLQTDNGTSELIEEAVTNALVDHFNSTDVQVQVVVTDAADGADASSNATSASGGRRLASAHYVDYTITTTAASLATHLEAASRINSPDFLALLHGHLLAVGGITGAAMVGVEAVGSNLATELGLDDGGAASALPVAIGVILTTVCLVCCVTRRRTTIAALRAVRGRLGKGRRQEGEDVIMDVEQPEEEYPPRRPRGVPEADDLPGPEAPPKVPPVVEEHEELRHLSPASWLGSAPPSELGEPTAREWLGRENSSSSLASSRWSAESASARSRARRPGSLNKMPRPRARPRPESDE